MHDDVLMAASQREAHERYPLPRLVLCLAHNAKVAWDVKWRPYSPNDPECKHHLGFLAVLLGNGSLEVYAFSFSFFYFNMLLVELMHLIL